MNVGAWAKQYRKALLTIGIVAVVVLGVRAGLYLSYGFALDAYKRGDYRIAVPLIWGSAIYRDPLASSLLGHMYLAGHGVARDGQKAEHWLLIGAEAGIVGSQSMLGVMYASGEGVPQDYAKARHWLTRAAVAGDAESARILKILPTSRNAT